MNEQKSSINNLEGQVKTKDAEIQDLRRDLGYAKRFGHKNEPFSGARNGEEMAESEESRLNAFDLQSDKPLRVKTGEFEVKDAKP